MREWLLGAYAFAIGVVFWPGTPGASISPRWALIGMGVWLFVKPVLITTQHVAILLLLTWSALTLTWSQFGYDGVDAWLRLFFLCGAFWMGSSVDSLRPVYIGFALSLGVSSVIVIAQWYGWQGIPQSVSPAGLFMNKNTVAEISALVLVGLVASKLWRFVPFVVPALIIPQSRAAIMAVGVALVVSHVRRPAILFGLMGFLVTVIALWAMQHPLGSFSDRWSYYTDTARQLTFFGHGLGSFNGLFPSFASSDTLAVRTDHVHNDYLEAVFEIGIVAVFIWWALFAVLARAVDSPERTVLIAVAVEMLFAFPLHLPCTAFLAALCLGHLCRDRAVVRNSVTDGGVSLQAGYGRAAH